MEKIYFLILFLGFRKFESAIIQPNMHQPSWTGLTIIVWESKKKISGVVEKIHDGRLDSEMNFEDFS